MEATPRRSLARPRFKTNFSGMVWLDIEDTNAHSYWGTDVAASKSFISGLLSAAAAEVGTSFVYAWSGCFLTHLCQAGIASGCTPTSTIGT